MVSPTEGSPSVTSTSSADSFETANGVESLSVSRTTSPDVTSTAASELSETTNGAVFLPDDGAAPLGESSNKLFRTNIKTAKIIKRIPPPIIITGRVIFLLFT